MVHVHEHDEKRLYVDGRSGNTYCCMIATSVKLAEGKQQKRACSGHHNPRVALAVNETKMSPLNYTLTQNIFILITTKP